MGNSQKSKIAKSVLRGWLSWQITTPVLSIGGRFHTVAYEYPVTNQVNKKTISCLLQIMLALFYQHTSLGRVAQSETFLTTDAHLTANPGGPVTSESMCTNYWLTTACSSLPTKNCG